MANLILQIPNAFSVGQDLSCSITDPVSGITRNLDEFGHLESFKVTAIDKEIEVAPISRGGVHLYQTLWAGCELDIRWAKVYAALEYFWTQLQNNYFDLHLLPSFMFNASVINRDGSVDEFAFTGAAVSKPTLGDYEGAKQVNNGMKARCQRGQLVSAGSVNAPLPGASPLSF